MFRQTLIGVVRITAAAVLYGASAVPVCVAGEALLAPQKSTAQGVTITVTPRNLSRDARSWDFAIKLETHTQDLGDDLVRSARLIADGRQTAPFAWDGAPPGGHHREGVLRFKPVSPHPQSVELRILRAGETAPRSFRWLIR
jgi:hypothetical protein